MKASEHSDVLTETMKALQAKPAGATTAQWVGKKSAPLTGRFGLSLSPVTLHAGRDFMENLNPYRACHSDTNLGISTI